MTYVWRSLFQRKVRTALSVLGVAVAVGSIVALISVALGMRSSLDNYMEDSGASLLVFSKSAADLAFSTVTTREIEAIKAFPGVDAVSRANFKAVLTFRRKDGTPSPIPLVLCFGRYPDERIMARYESQVVAGKMFRSEGEILVSRYLADTMGWARGETIDLLGEKLEIVGIFVSEIAWENGGVIVHAEVVSRALGRKDSYQLLFVYTAAGRRDAVAERIETDLPKLVAVPPAEFTARFSGQLAIIDEFIVIITLISLTVGVLGVLNTMMMSVSERTREIGMLRALGWSRARVMKTILAEGMLLSVLGGIVGLALGVLGTELLLANFANTYLIAKYVPATFVKGGVVAILVGVLAALYPAYRASSLRPVEALRYE